MKQFQMSQQPVLTDTRKGLYIAILNQGTIRTELSALINNWIFNQHYRTYLAYPDGKPIVHNRNQIVQDFLSKPEYDYLMMVDSDILPPADVIKLADYDKDIISPVCFMFDGKGIIPLVLEYEKEENRVPGQKPYKIMDLAGNEGLTEVGAVGTGCIFIHRRVLEKMKAPFLNIFDENGVKSEGNDLRFCTNARAAGFKVWCHLDYVAGHMVSMDLKMLYRAFTNREEIKKVELK